MSEPVAGDVRDGDGPGPHHDGGLPAPAPKLVLARATVNLPGLHRDEVALVDPTVPYVADCLAALYLVPLPAHLQPDGERPKGDVE
jgi:hypothetical protein